MGSVTRGGNLNLPYPQQVHDEVFDRTMLDIIRCVTEARSARVSSGQMDVTPLFSTSSGR